MNKLFVALCCVVFPSVALAQHAANHLVITEVAYDTTDETASTAEYIEIHNPTNAAVALGNYYLTDVNVGYWNVVNGNVAVAGNQDFLVQFPATATIPAHGTVVVAMHSADFLAEFFGANLATFEALPGKPQLFEVFQDGATDGVPDMIPRYTTTATVQGLTNGGEPAILFYWDGTSDLVKDVDMIVWGSTTQVPNKTGITVDGPDADALGSLYLPESPSTAVFLGTAANINSVQRAHVVETETATTGNGLGGHSEVSEDWTIATGGVVLALDTPGAQLIRSNGSVDDALSFLAPVGTSPADGPGTGTTTADFGADGTVTELYASLVDVDLNRTPDSLYFAIRGSFFGTVDDNDNNATMVLVDLNPQLGQVGGVKTIISNGNQLADTTGSFDTRVTTAGFLLDAGYSGTGFDLAVGTDARDTSTADLAGARGWGTGGAPGTTSDFNWLTNTLVSFDPTVASQLPGAPGTTYAAENGIEVTLPLSGLSAPPTYIYVVAVTTSDTSEPSPNTVPESSGNAFGGPHLLDRGACVELATGRVVVRYADMDGDGVGGSTPYCGPLTTNVSESTGDCDDSDAARFPGNPEICDAKDNNCAGGVDDGLTFVNYYRDQDSDTYGAPGTVQNACAQPTGFVTNNTDCNDAVASINPGATELPGDGTDQNCDAVEVCYRDGDGDGFRTTMTVVSNDLDCADVGEANANEPAGDCDDAQPNVNPSRPEVCDGVDNNCSGVADEGVSTAYYRDSDADTYGDPNTSQNACTAPSGFVTNNTDCNDSNAAIKPGATEVCNGLDDDCDMQTDEGLTLTSFYPDTDTDNFGAGTGVQACVAPPGHVANNTDCNDSNAAINPSAQEVCDVGNVDEDCDGNADDADTAATGTTPFYRDLDADTFGAGTATQRCDPATGFVTNNTDCNDSVATTNPNGTETCNAADDDCDSQTDEGFNVGMSCNNGQQGACARTGMIACQGNGTAACDAPTVTGTAETCNGTDDDCNGMVDEGVLVTFYRDSDSDTFGSATVTQMACSAPTGYVAAGTDCDDTVATINPNGTETCNQADDDCDGTVDENVKTTFYADGDADGVGGTTTQQACAQPTGYVSTTGDCDDADLNVKPGATETCDTKDNDCDGTVDENVKTTFYVDADGDGAGGTTTQDACAAPTGYVATSNDCDDADDAKKPSGTEVCDGKDNNCDGTTDEGVQTTFYVDADGDGQGSQSSVSACAAPAGHAANNTDCNDANADVKKADKEEACTDALDNDCDGKADADDTEDCEPAAIDPEPACGCSSGTSAMFAPALLMALALIRRRRQ